MLKGENNVDEAVMRVPPNNADAEKSVLGCMMQDREALSLAFELLTADDFYHLLIARFSMRCTRSIRRACPSIW